MPVTSSSQWKVAPPDLYGCTLWLGTLDKDGYPILWRGRESPQRAHRAVYVERHGPDSLPPGFEIEHRCRRRACMTDAHHMRVSRQVNERMKRWRYRVKVPVCAAGHDSWLYAMTTPEGGRVCRLCSFESGDRPNFFGRTENEGEGG